LLDAATKAQPAAWLAKIIRNRQAEREREQAHEQAMLGFASGGLPSTTIGGGNEPEWLRGFRTEGYRIAKRDDGRWRVGGRTYTAEGQCVGW
jgi:hypothetical protein